MASFGRFMYSMAILLISAHFKISLILKHFNFVHLKITVNNQILSYPILSNFIFDDIEETPFYGGIFRCKLVIDGEFP